MIRIIRNIQEFPPLQTRWRYLAREHGSPLLDYDWFFAAAEAFCPPCELHTLCYEEQGEIKAIAPLVLRQNGKTAILEFLGADFLSEPGGFLYEDHNALRQLIRGIQALNKPVFLKRLPLNSPDVNLLKLHASRNALVSFRHVHYAPYLSFSGDWHQFEKSLSARRRSDIRRALRRAEGQGALQFRFIAPGSENHGALLNDFYRVESCSWKGRNGSAVIQKPLLKKFFDTYSGLTAQKGIFRVGLLQIANETAAAFLGVEYGNRFWLLKIGYDEKFGRVSPGILLIHRAIRHAYERGLSGFEFLGYDDAWLQLWRPQKRAHVFAHLYPRTFSGWKVFSMDVLNIAMKRLA